MKLCTNCMRKKEIDEKVCKNCGYTNNAAQNEHYFLDEGTKLNDRYIVGRVLGHGGFGITYIGYDTKQDEVVAIKEYLPTNVSTRAHGEAKVTTFDGAKYDEYIYGLGRFIDEAMALTKHREFDCIVTINDYFEENNTAYIVMEYLDGTTLNDYINKHGGILSVEDTLIIMKPILEGLKQVHASGMIHRDISPDNIFVTKDKEVKLLDFGAARYAMSEKSKSLSVILKPGYAPLEQYYTKGKQGPWSDIYSLAATMHKMLTGKVPPEAMERATQNGIHLSELNNLEDEAMKNKLKKALSLKYQDRYRDIDEFYNVLFTTKNKAEAKKETIDKSRKSVSDIVKNINIASVKELASKTKKNVYNLAKNINADSVKELAGKIKDKAAPTVSKSISILKKWFNPILKKAKEIQKKILNTKQVKQIRKKILSSQFIENTRKIKNFKYYVIIGCLGLAIIIVNILNVVQIVNLANPKVDTVIDQTVSRQAAEFEAEEYYLYGSENGMSIVLLDYYDQVNLIYNNKEIATRKSNPNRRYYDTSRNEFYISAYNNELPNDELFDLEFEICNKDGEVIAVRKLENIYISSDGYIPKKCSNGLIINTEENDVNEIIEKFNENNLENLECLYISNKSLNLDAIDFENLENLKILRMSFNNLEGNLSDLVLLKNLESLIINPWGSSSSEINVKGNLEELAKLNKIKNLIISGSSLNTERLRGLENMESLEMLKLNYTRVLQGDLSVISKLHNLKTFIYMEAPSNEESWDDEIFTLKNLEAINNFQKLEYLHLNTKLDGDFSYFQNLHRLKTLIISDVYYNDLFIGEITTLNNFEKLEYLELDTCGKLEGLISDIELNNLKIMSINYCFNFKGNISDIKGLNSLERLFLYDSDFSGTLSDFKTLSSLINLHLHDNEYISGDLSQLDALSGLEYFSLYGRDNITGDLSHLAALKNLKYLQMEEYNDCYSGNLADFGQLANLEELQLYGIHNIHGEFSDLSNNKNLVKLTLGECIGIECDIAGLSDIKNLKFIGIYGISSIYGDISRLNKLKELKSFSLTSCPNVTGDIGELDELKNLTYLYISDCANIEGTLTLENGAEVKVEE